MKTEGQIVTFYSFKGGVGRTMALANVAFLAAMNGHRILVMDWDLEAPGLAYYFRGLLDAPDAKALKEAPGVLNILWDWSQLSEQPATEVEFETQVGKYKDGIPFRSCVRPLLMSELLPAGAKLDFIGAGSRAVGTCEPRPYEEALAHFSWPAFFENAAGGVVLSYFRQWAKENYDYVLIDSRTGLADVAGICTMQLPDTVALCFILNRQNIDGVAKIAAAIRNSRDEAVTLRAVPMRVSRNDTSEESDARARALSELTRVGGFSLDSAQEDFRALEVKLADNVPFFETLAPFSAPDPKYDVLTLNYLRLGSHILGKPLDSPQLRPEYIETVRRRLQPRHATVEYVTKLMSAEPDRAITELIRLIESAFETEIDGGGLEKSYVTSLVEASLRVSEITDDHSIAAALHDRALELLRVLVENDPGNWRGMLISTIERSLETVSFFRESEEESELLEEIDALLARQQTVGARLKRISYRRKAARHFLVENGLDLTMQTVGEINSLVKEVLRDGGALSEDQLEEIQAAEIDAFILSGIVYEEKSDAERAYKEYRAGLSKFTNIEPERMRAELSRLRSELHCRLALISHGEITMVDAANHAIQAFVWGSGHTVIFRFISLANVVINVPNEPALTLAFCEAALQGTGAKIRFPLTTFYGRQSSSSEAFLQTISKLAKSISSIRDSRMYAALESLAQATRGVLQNLGRRKQTIGEKQRKQLSAQLSETIATLKAAGLPPEACAELESHVTNLAPRRQRGTSTADTE